MAAGRPFLVQSPFQQAFHQFWDQAPITEHIDTLSPELFHQLIDKTLTDPCTSTHKTELIYRRT